MARRTATAPLRLHVPLKCQVRLAAAKSGIRVSVATGPGSPAFTEVRIWPDTQDASREVVLDGGTSATTNLQIAADEDFWVAIAFAPGKKHEVHINYVHRKPFGYKAEKVINPLKVEMIGSVPRIRTA